MAVQKTPVSAMVTVDSDVLGELNLPEDRIVSFPDGLLGFPDTSEYVLVPAGRSGTYWLQSVEHASLIFFLVDPFEHFDDYAVELSAAEADTIQASARDDVAVLAIVTLPGEEGARPTANLQGPLALNLRDGIGRQIVLRRRGLGVRRAFDLKE